MDFEQRTLETALAGKKPYKIPMPPDTICRG